MTAERTTEGSDVNELPVAEPTRERIIQAAYTVFGNKGYAAATTRAIAAEAGVNEVTLFRHFGNKKNLFKAMVDTFYDFSGLSSIPQRLLTGDYRQELNMIGSRIVAVLKERKQIYRLLLSEVEAESEVRETMVTLPRRVRQMLAQYFEYQIAQGKMRPVHPEIAAQAFMSMFMAFVTYDTIFGESPIPEIPDADIVAQFVDIFIEGTVN